MKTCVNCFKKGEDFRDTCPYCGYSYTYFSDLMKQEKASKSVDLSASMDVYKAVESGNIDAVTSCIKNGNDVNAMYDGLTGLMVSAFKGHTHIARLLIDAKANVNAKGNDGITGLMIAALKGHADIARLLIDAKADINAEDNSRRTALIIAIQKGHTDIVDMLNAAIKANEDARQKVDMALNSEELIEELVKIGPSYLGKPGGNYDEHFNHKRAREIGEVLNIKGGMGLMLEAHSIVLNKYGNVVGRELESCWNNIGRWEG